MNHQFYSGLVECIGGRDGPIEVGEFIESRVNESVRYLEKMCSELTAQSYNNTAACNERLYSG